MKTSVDDAPEFVLTRQEYEKADRAVELGETYLIYRYFNWGEQNQELRVYDFKNMKRENKIMPRTYLCSLVDRATEISGITRCREVLDMSMKDLAAYLGITVPMLWRYETGEAGCPVQTLQKASGVLGVTIDELLKWHAVEHDLSQLC